MNAILTKYHFSKEKIKSEAEIIRRAKTDTANFEVLYKNYHPQIFLFILKRVASEDIAADITSQVFLKALLNISKYVDKGLPFGSWLYRIARNELYNSYHQNKIELVVSVESKGIWEIISQLGESSKEDDHTKLHNALKRLTEEEMELIELRFFEVRPFKEVAEILEITENNAKVRTYRVLDKLKSMLTTERK